MQPNIKDVTSAKIILDSISPLGIRLTTMEVKFPRYILPEFNTQRSFCLSKDTKLYFDDINYIHYGKRKQQTFTIEQVYNYFKNNKKYSKASTKDKVEAKKFFETFLLRQVDESTGKVIHTRISNVFDSGQKALYEIKTRKGRSIVCSKDHKLLTDKGWQTLTSLGAYKDLESNVVHLPEKVCLMLTTAYESYFEAIVEIKQVRWDQCYDIEVDSQYHNFVANGIVVHNSRNSASSRAIPVWKQLKQVIDCPVIPEFQKNKAGMWSNEPLSDEELEDAIKVWLNARTNAVESAAILCAREEKTKTEISAWEEIDCFLEDTYTTIGVHKQWVNRLLEPFMWHTVIVSATEWDNFFHLRCEKDAQPEIYVLSNKMLEVYLSSSPKELKYGEWHIPYLQESDSTLSVEDQLKCSVARCARVSYLNHDGTQDIAKDIVLHDRLAKSGHWSAFEHTAETKASDDYYGNFRGFLQYRKLFSNECPTDINLKNKLWIK